MMLPKEKLFLFNKFIDEEIDPKQERIKEPIKNGLMLVGDAAHQTNPMTGGGISSGSGYGIQL